MKFHPSEYFVEILMHELNLTKKELFLFLDGKFDVNDFLAKELEKFTNISRGTWINLQRKYDGK